MLKVGHFWHVHLQSTIKHNYVIIIYIQGTLFFFFPLDYNWLYVPPFVQKKERRFCQHNRDVQCMQLDFRIFMFQKEGQ